MTTRTYSDLYSLIQAMCGEVFATNEVSRINFLLNQRAKRAYLACNYWPRFLVVGEERDVTAGVIPFTETGLDTIDSFIRIFRTQPYETNTAQEFDFYVTTDGAKIIDGNLDAASAFVTYRKALSDQYGDGSGQTDTVPDEWFEYIAYGTYADWLRAEKYMQEAIVADQQAQAILDDELIKVDLQGTPSLVIQKVRTNANMQSRR